MTSYGPPPRWLVTGAGGMLGRDLLTVLTGTGATVTAATHADLDITDAAAVRDAVVGHDIVVNAAGYTDVDGAEADEATATAVNGHAVESLAHACADVGARLIGISTDYVFGGVPATLPAEQSTGAAGVGPAAGSGAGSSAVGVPYPEEHPTAPVNAYGRSKLVGEQAILRTLPNTGYVVRTAWLYGYHGRNFVATMLRLATERDTVDVVDDQYGQPTWTVALASQIVELGTAAVAGHPPAGIYHGTAAGQTTWYGLARAVFAQAGHDPDRVRPTRTEALRRPARRPAYSVLGHDRWRLAGVPAQPHWEESLRAALTSWGPMTASTHQEVR